VKCKDNRPLSFNLACILVEAIRAMFTAAFTAITALEVILFGEDDITFFTHIVILRVKFRLITGTTHAFKHTIRKWIELLRFEP
jgi:hypothetical protein